MTTILIKQIQEERKSFTLYQAWQTGYNALIHSIFRDLLTISRILQIIYFRWPLSTSAVVAVKHVYLVHSTLDNNACYLGPIPFPIQNKTAVWKGNFSWLSYDRFVRTMLVIKFETFRDNFGDLFPLVEKTRVLAEFWYFIWYFIFMLLYWWKRMPTINEISLIVLRSTCYLKEKKEHQLTENLKTKTYF